MSISNEFGVVVIGRNEGERLRRCLRSVQNKAAYIVYVDSGSTDGSVEFALSTPDVKLVSLDMSKPFTAARARNEGFSNLMILAPDLRYVQFIDGDCELVHGWLENAISFLGVHDEVGVVSGRLMERHPDVSIYNLLCDMEWDTPAGEAKACGGIAMFRTTAFKTSGGFNESLIAGEEPELCLRMRTAGLKVWRLDTPMAWHDAAITQFKQWWKRNVRAGLAYAEGAWLHRNHPENYWVKETLSAVSWGIGIPLLISGLTILYGYAATVLIAAYPLQVFRLAIHGKYEFKQNLLRAFFLVMGKFAESVGCLNFMLNRLRHTQAVIIEYK